MAPVKLIFVKYFIRLKFNNILNLQKVAAAAPAKNVKKVKVVKKKKLNLKFTIDCTHPVEDGILDMVSFVS